VVVALETKQSIVQGVWAAVDGTSPHLWEPSLCRPDPGAGTI